MDEILMAELQKEKDDITKEYTDFLLEQTGIVILKENNRIIGIYSPSLKRELYRCLDRKNEPRNRYVL